MYLEEEDVIRRNNLYMTEEDSCWWRCMYKSCSRLASEDIICTKLVWSCHLKKFYVQKYDGEVVDGRKKYLCCLDEAFPEGEHPLNPPYPLCSPLPGHPLVFQDGPGPLLGQLCVPWSHLVQLSQQAINLCFYCSKWKPPPDLANQKTSSWSLLGLPLCRPWYLSLASARVCTSWCTPSLASPQAPKQRPSNSPNYSILYSVYCILVAWYLILEAILNTDYWILETI